VRSIIKQKLNSRVDQDSVAKVRDAFRKKYALEKNQLNTSLPERKFPREIYPEGHKLYPVVLRPEQHKFLLETEYTCPNCGKKFQGEKLLASRLVPSKAVRYDMRKFYKDYTPEWYEIKTCPHCYFSMFGELFAEKRKLSKDAVADALQKARSLILLDFEKERDVNLVFTMHYLALLCAAGYANKLQLDRRLWTSLNWLYEDVGDDEMMRYTAKKAAEANEKVYELSELSPEQEQMILLSAAAMLHRAGVADDNVLKYLMSVKLVKGGKKIYSGLADDLLEAVRNGKN